MVVAMVGTAERHDELVAGFALHGAWLSEAEVVRVRGRALADQARLGRHECQVPFVALTAWFAEGELAFVDFGGRR